jgi:hypothetical protein
MRQRICTAFAAGALSLASAAQAEPQPVRPTSPTPLQAPFAERYGAPADYRAPTPGKGYSAEARRRVDCLASFPGYDWRTDKIHVEHQPVRPCPL